MKFNFVRICAIAAVTLLSGCATIFNWNTRANISIGCDQPNARVRVYNCGRTVAEMQTPANMTIKSSSGWFRRSSYVFEFSKPGYLTTRETRVARMSGWYWWNIAIGGVVGMLIVDPLTGSVFGIKDAPVWAHLQKNYSEEKTLSPVKAEEFKVNQLTYDEETHKGIIVLEVTNNQFDRARKWARNYIETLARDKNVALETGSVPSEAKFYLGRESIRDGAIMEIEFQVE